MDEVFQHFRELEVKINQLYWLVERLTNQVNSLISQKEEHSTAIKSDYSMLTGLGSHQDVLIDDSGENIKIVHQDIIDPEIQIKRLTAQLTAAYNRIAALEEQLVYKRTIIR